jgi:RNA chaperone Hfq
MGTAKQQIQEEFLNMLTKEHVRVSVFLVNGIRLVATSSGWTRMC